jgi:DNA-directed RNA polymerase specialized sigma24 family protein
MLLAELVPIRTPSPLLPELPPMQYATILLHVWGDYPFAEVGAIIECSPEAVRKLFARAVATLTRDLEFTN